MTRLLRLLAFVAVLLACPVAHAAVATIYVDTGGCNTGSTTQCSGTTDSATATASGASATITCSATAGPGSTPGCSLSGTPDLSGVATDGSQAIFVNCATNTNQKIFFINAVDNAVDPRLVGTTTTPTGCTAATSDWGIGGRYIFPSGATVNLVVNALRAGDTIQFNQTPATKTANYITTNVAGDSTTGSINIIGKAGVRPVLNVTSGAVSAVTFSHANWTISNLELKAAGATANGVLIMNGNGGTANNIIVSQSGGAPGIGLLSSGTGSIVVNSEVTSGVTGDGINTAVSSEFYGNYIHGAGGDCLEINAFVLVMVSNNVLSGCTGRGLYMSSASITSFQLPVVVVNNTIYGNGNSGFEVVDADARVLMYNNIFQENGNAAGEFNVEWAAGNAQLASIHGYNLFYHSNCEGSASSTTCVSGLTTNATEVAGSSASFTNAGSSDFTLQAGSPALATAYPGLFLNGSTGYLDIGALQKASSGGSGCVGC